ncbi:MAG TPA: hypothetical protein VE981_13695 [Planctomycetota bacterium]|nr:hypothetical protein [Planctomycetota bacterium]
MRALAIALLGALLAQEQVDQATKGSTFTMPADLTLRARVTAITPSEPTSITWRWGGEGLGGEVQKGEFGQNLAVGVWSPAVPVASLVIGKFPGKLFLTVMAGSGGRKGEGGSKNVEIEFEVALKGKSLKTFKEAGPDGGTVGVIIPGYRLAGGKTPEDAAFLEEFDGLLDYARRRAARLEALPAATGPRPSKFGIVTNLGGYGAGHGYGIRYTNPAVLEAELRGLKVLGVNGLGEKTHAKDFRHVVYAQLGGYPVPSAKKGQSIPDAGCPFAPGVAARQKEMIDAGLGAALKMDTDEVWWRTEDEIGAVIDRAPEGKGHFAACPTCTAAFRSWLKELGVADWAHAKPADLSAKGAEPSPMTYYTAMFSTYASAKLFTPLRDAIAKANEEKRKNPTLKQPYVYSFALRGNTFLMGGHSLDFFDFYRHADNAMVYETSNRDARVWGWDSTLCDVGRVLTERMHTEFGVYVKPHRGAPVQRALAAVSRGAKMIYWYTYGPDYVKGDSFAENEAALDLTAKAAGLLGRAEDLLYGATLAEAPGVAVVNPRSSEIWNKAAAGGSPAAYENAKWISTALAHAHIPVDPIDEGMLAADDLSRYSVIYVSGTNLTVAAATKLEAWVKAGGTLYTSGGGLARDETNQPLAVLEPALGVGRGAVELWAKVKPYGATALESWADSTSPGAAVEISGPGGKFVPVVGREALQPAAGTEVLASFADKSAALTKHAHGMGQVYVAAFFPGLEYSAALRTEDYDMSRDFDAVKRGLVTIALAGVRPVVDASQPLVEGLLLQNGDRRAVTLMNWAYKHAGKKSTTVVYKDLAVEIRADARKVTSTATGRDLPVERTKVGIKVVLPLLEEGDVLRLE